MKYCEMKKIVMYTSGRLFQTRQTGGLKRFIELARYFSNNNFQFTIYSQDNADEILAEIGLQQFVKMNSADSNWKYLPPEAALLLSNGEILKKLKRSVYDYLIVFDVPTAVGLVLHGLTNIVLMIRKDMIGYELVNLEGRWYKACFKLLYQWICESLCLWKSKTIICQCIYDKNILKKRHPFLNKLIERKTKIQINNVNPSWVVSGSLQIADDHVSIPLKQTNFRICFIGEFDNPRKGQDLFLATAMELLSKRNDLEFILVGGGTRLDEYKCRFNHESIFFTGRLSSSLYVLQSSDLLVVPSWADSCPNTVLEALYNRIPVIGSRAGGIPEILVNDNCLFELTQSSLRDCILKLVGDFSALEKLKELQFERREELTFDWAQTISNLIIR